MALRADQVAPSSGHLQLEFADLTRSSLHQCCLTGRDQDVSSGSVADIEGVPTNVRYGPT